MISEEYREAITETLDILKHTRNEDVMRISPKFIEFLKENASETYKPKLDHTKTIEDMCLKEKTKVLLAIINKKFWSDEQQNQEEQNKLQLEELQETYAEYDLDSIFKDKKLYEKKEKEEVIENVSMVERKESLIVKAINIIKKIFRKI